MILFTYLAPLWGWLGERAQLGLPPEHLHVLPTAPQSRGGWTSYMEAEQAPQENQEETAIAFPDLASEVAQHYLRSILLVTRVVMPSQIRGEGSKLHFLMVGHIAEELGGYCCSHLWKI